MTGKVFFSALLAVIFVLGLAGYSFAGEREEEKEGFEERFEERFEDPEDEFIEDFFEDFFEREFFFFNRFGKIRPFFDD